MNAIASYTFESNALFISEKLKEAEIVTVMDVTATHGNPRFDIKVNAEDMDKAWAIISGIKVDETAVDPEAAYKGHWKYTAPVLILLGIAGLAAAIYTVLHPLPYGLDDNLAHKMYLFALFIGSSFFLFTGISMLWQLAKRKRGSN